MKKWLMILAMMSVTTVYAQESTNPSVVIHTNKGEITVELFADKAPKTVENFLTYVDADHYAGTIFHRVIGHFMIQGGGFTAELKQKQTRAPITNEADNGLSNTRGTIAMARLPDPHSATAQFFINVVDNPFLDHKDKSSAQSWGYAVFGKVTGGMDVVDAIRTVPTAPKRPLPSDVPTEDIVISKIERVRAASDSAQ